MACDKLVVGGICAQWILSDSLAKYVAIDVCIAWLIDWLMYTMQACMWMALCVGMQRLVPGDCDVINFVICLAQGACTVMHCLLHDQVIWVPEPSPVTQLLPVVSSNVRQLIADTQRWPVACGWPGLVEIHPPSARDCRHVFPGKMWHGTCCRMGF